MTCWPSRVISLVQSSQVCHTDHPLLSTIHWPYCTASHVHLQQLRVDFVTFTTPVFCSLLANTYLCHCLILWCGSLLWDNSMCWYLQDIAVSVTSTSLPSYVPNAGSSITVNASIPLPSSRPTTTTIQPPSCKLLYFTKSRCNAFKWLHN